MRRAAVAGASAEALAELVGSGPVPVAIEALSLGLGVAAVAMADIEGAAGMLVPARSAAEAPVIIVRSHDAARRRRFTVAHELAHHLLGHAALERPCDGAEEAQADRLAALLLAPPALVQRFLVGARPDVSQVGRLAGQFEISVDAACRAYVEFHPEAMALVIARGGTVERSYRDRRRFPFVPVPIGSPVPAGSALHRLRPGRHRVSRSVLDPAIWLVPGDDWSDPLEEQILAWRSGSALILLTRHTQSVGAGLVAMGRPSASRSA